MKRKIFSFEELSVNFNLLNQMEREAVNGGLDGVLFIANPYSNTSVFKVNEYTGEVALLEGPEGLVWNANTETFDWPSNNTSSSGGDDDTLYKVLNGVNYVSFDNGLTWEPTLDTVEITGTNPNASFYTNDGATNGYLGYLQQVYGSIYGNGYSGSGGGSSSGYNWGGFDEDFSYGATSNSTNDIDTKFITMLGAASTTAGAFSGVMGDVHSLAKIGDFATAAKDMLKNMGKYAGALAGALDIIVSGFEMLQDGKLTTDELAGFIANQIVGNAIGSVPFAGGVMSTIYDLTGGDDWVESEVANLINIYFNEYEIYAGQ